MLDRELSQSVVLIHDPNEDIQDLIGCFAAAHRHIVYHLIHKVKRNFGAEEAATKPLILNTSPTWPQSDNLKSAGSYAPHTPLAAARLTITTARPPTRDAGLRPRLAERRYIAPLFEHNLVLRIYTMVSR